MIQEQAVVSVGDGDYPGTVLNGTKWGCGESASGQPQRGNVKKKDTRRNCWNCDEQM
ncbi:MAG: hypothetical protein ACLTER_20790 [Ruminococcus sp.]